VPYTLSENPTDCVILDKVQTTRYRERMTILRHSTARRVAYALAGIAHRIGDRLDDALNRELRDTATTSAFRRDLRRLGIED
jgi:hypothetical protein